MVFASLCVLLCVPCVLPWSLSCSSFEFFATFALKGLSLLPPATQSITDVSVPLPSFDEVLRTLTLRAGHNAAVVVLGTTLLGLAAGVIGTFALLRKRALMGDALAHATLPGIALAFLAATALGGQGRSLPVLLIGAAATGVLGILAVQAITRSTRLKEDTAIGAVLSVFFGVGVVLLSYIQSLQRGNVGGLAHFIYGQTAAMSRGDALLIGSVAAASVALALLLMKEFRVVCFDDRFAAAIGLPVGFIDLLMMTLVVIVTVIGLQAVGLILIVAMLIIPPAAARFWTERMARMTLAAGGIGALSGYLGASASALLPRLPAGSIIVLTAGALFLVSMFLAPTRGVLAAALRTAALRLHVAREHTLRGAYEALEVRVVPATAGATAEGPAPSPPASSAPPPVPLSSIAAVTTMHPLVWLATKLSLRRRGLATTGPNFTLHLTPRGLAEAARLTRNHRLWEEYLVTHADIAPTHVDRSADLVEHILSPDLVAHLERSLRARGELPVPPPSVHPIQGLRTKD